ncbi:MAG: SAM-dependent methyltransferase, partial [Bacteroidia bacterium]|nr:SAM-dependent methyltransferase [Bacteroidia bacterium]
MSPRRASLGGLGVVETPAAGVEAMLSLLPERLSSSLKVLEPACGEAPFLRAFARKYGSSHRLYGVDVRSEPLAAAAQALPLAHFFHADYLLWNPSERFDLILGNPPYGIVGDASHYAIPELLTQKPIYKKFFTTWFGKYNLYGAFIEKSIRLLSDRG